MPDEPENSGLKSLRRARDLLAGYLATAPADHPLVAVKTLLARVDAEMRRLLEVKPTKTRSGHNVRYRIEFVDDKPLLTERRPGSVSRPFRVSREVYEATAKVLDAAGRPLLFDEIVDGVNRRMPSPPPPFHIRTCLRFWTRAPRAPLSRLKTRYVPVTSGHLHADAQNLWDELQAKGALE